MRALTVIGGLLISPYTVYELKKHLASKLVRYYPSSIYKKESELKQSFYKSNYLD